MGTPLLWIGFNIFVIFMLALDLGVFHRRAHAISLREAATWSVVWVAVSLLFNYGLLHWYGRTPAVEFLAGYLIEKSLSVDNIFVFVLLFRYFAVEPRFQHRVLFWGIVGALLMRGIMIGAGVALIHRFEWVLYLFGAFLLYAGAKMMFQKDEQVHPEHNPVLRWARRFIPITKEYAGQKLFVRHGRFWMATPLFLVLLVVETTDLAFAVDSIPAVFGVTRDPFIVYTSNIFAILGLRAFYFLLAGVLPYFRYLGVGLSLVLMFIGGKMLAAPWFEIPTHIALVVVGGILTVAVTASIAAARVEVGGKAKPAPRHKPHAEAARGSLTPALGELIGDLAGAELATRESAARTLHDRGVQLCVSVLRQWSSEPAFAALLLRERPAESGGGEPRATVGVAVKPEHFEAIRAANASPRLAHVPPDQDAREFELRFEGGARLDILTTNAPGGGGALAKYLAKFGEGIQQVEYEVSDVDRATEILRARFGLQPVYPATRAGADATRVNFFLVAAQEGRKVLIELVESPREKQHQ
jgi:tellurite resistance protein TerC